MAQALAAAILFGLLAIACGTPASPDGDASDAVSSCALNGIDLWGNVHIAASSAFADLDVFVADAAAFADLKVFEVDSAAFADRCGRWFFTDTPAWADFSIYLTSSAAFADLVIFPVTSAAFAGE